MLFLKGIFNIPWLLYKYKDRIEFGLEIKKVKGVFYQQLE